MGEIAVYEVRPGSLVVLRGIDLDELGVGLDGFMDALERVCGHRKFVVLQVADGNAVVHGAEDIVAELRAAFGIDITAKPIPIPTQFDGGKVVLQ